ncbi:hypothetical protein OL548_15510 [Lysinibacillus sp. MHQ-1]|nr:hypothetical protein OL548_15510 [Lysinibacillus sp. MHQ-1]
MRLFLFFTSYAMIISYYYITPYATAAFGASTLIAAALGYFSQYCRPIGSFSAGIIGDRIGVSNMVLIGYILLALGLVGLILLPGKASFILMLLIFIGIIYTSMYALQAMHFAILVEGDYPVESTGTVSMPLMIIGYSGEIFMPIIAGACLDYWGGTAGYKVFFWYFIRFSYCWLRYSSHLATCDERKNARKLHCNESLRRTRCLPSLAKK